MDEKLRILKMVEEGAITAEQGAETDGSHEFGRAGAGDSHGKWRI